jgi:DMSO/TMAO reductase YedYZ molybdopterin-dependent catalytic subunit
VKKKITQMLLLITLIWIIFLGFFIGGFGSEFPTTALAVEGGTEWTVQIYGAVTNPIQLTLTELAAMPQTTVFANLYCIDDLVASGDWTGVKLSLILEKVEMNSQAQSVKFTADDDYTSELWITEAMRDDVIIAYAKDEQPLPEVLRLVFPGENGHRWISGIIQMEVSLGQATILEMTAPPITNPLLSSPEPFPTPTLKPSPTLTPTPSPSSDPSPSPSTLPATETRNTEAFPTAPLALSTLTVVGALILVYFKRRNK